MYIAIVILGASLYFTYRCLRSRPRPWMPKKKDSLPHNVTFYSVDDVWDDKKAS